MARMTLAIAVLLTPALALAAPRTFSELADLVVSILDTGAGLLILAGVVVYFWGISTNILKMKDEGGQAFKNYVLWGLVALFVMVSIWGIIRLIQSTIFGGDYYGSSSSFQGVDSAPSFQNAPSFQ